MSFSNKPIFMCKKILESFSIFEKSNLGESFKRNKQNPLPRSSNVTVAIADGCFSSTKALSANEGHHLRLLQLILQLITIYLECCSRFGQFYPSISKLSQ